MRIGFVIPAITAGGAERVVVRLANFLAASGVDVFLFTRQPPGIDFGINSQITAVTLGELDAPQLIAAVERYRIDVISDHFHWSPHHIGQLALVAAQNIKIILSEHNSYFFPLYLAQAEANPAHRAFFEQRAQLYRQFAAVTTLTRASADRLTSEGLANVSLMHNPLSYDRLDPAPCTQPRILNVSSFHKPAKRVDRLFQAFAGVQAGYAGARLRIVGDFDYTHYLQWTRAARVPPSAVEIMGRSADVAPHYLASSVFALTSEIEGQPMVLLEAAGHGLPQIAYGIAGLEDQILHGETGFIVPPGDHVTYATHALELLRDRQLRQTMGNRARAFVHETFNLPRIGARWLQLLTAVHETGTLSAALRHPAAALPPANYTPDALPPAVSVIVMPGSDDQRLTRCLETLQLQTMRDIEIIHDGRQPRGAYLAFVNGDDWVDADFVRRLHQAALLADADIVECACKPRASAREGMWGKLYRNGFWRDRDAHLRYQLVEDVLYYTGKSG